MYARYRTFIIVQIIVLLHWSIIKIDCWERILQSVLPYPSNIHKVQLNAKSTLNATMVKQKLLHANLSIYKKGTNFYNFTQQLTANKSQISQTQLQLLYTANTSQTYYVVILPTNATFNQYTLSFQINGSKILEGKFYITSRYSIQTVIKFNTDKACHHLIELKNIIGIARINIIYKMINSYPFAIYAPKTQNFTQQISLPFDGVWYIVIVTYNTLMVQAYSVSYADFTLYSESDSFYLYKYGNESQCKKNCSKFQNSFNFEPFHNLCDCASNFVWDYQTQKCVKDCSEVSNADLSIKGSSCTCKQNFRYDSNLNVCRIKCNELENTELKSQSNISTFSQCKCKPFYEWNFNTFQCMRTLQFITSVKYSIVTAFITLTILLFMVIAYFLITISKIKTKIQSSAQCSKQDLDETRKICITNTANQDISKKYTQQINFKEIKSIRQQVVKNAPIVKGKSQNYESINELAPKEQSSPQKAVKNCINKYQSQAQAYPNKIIEQKDIQLKHKQQTKQNIINQKQQQPKKQLNLLNHKQQKQQMEKEQANTQQFNSSNVQVKKVNKQNKVIPHIFQFEENQKQQKQQQKDPEQNIQINLNKDKFDQCKAPSRIRKMNSKVKSKYIKSKQQGNEKSQSYDSYDNYD